MIETVRVCVFHTMSSTVFRRNGIFAVTESETYAFSQRRLVEPYRRRRRPGYGMWGNGGSAFIGLSERSWLWRFVCLILFVRPLVQFSPTMKSDWPVSALTTHRASTSSRKAGASSYNGFFKVGHAFCRKLLPEASPVNKIDTVRSFSNNFLQIQSVMSTGQQATGRSRWSGLEQSQNNFNGQPITGQLISDTGVQSGSTFDNTGNNQNFGTGTIVRSNFRREDDGPNSDYYRCYYNNVPEPLL